MPDFPESIDPLPEQKLFEKLSMDEHEYEMLQYIRRQMTTILKQEGKNEEEK
jgi:hypothetical protein